MVKPKTKNHAKFLITLQPFFRTHREWLLRDIAELEKLNRRDSWNKA